MAKKCVICLKKYSKGVFLFKFPKKCSHEVMEKWLKAAGFDVSKIPNESECICSDHFRDDEMKESGKGKKVLINKSKCFPTVNICNKPRKFIQLIFFPTLV